MPRPRRQNPWSSTSEVLVWVLFAMLLFPAGFAGYAVGHYTSLGKPPKTVVNTVTVGSTSAPTTSTAGTTSQATTTSPGGGGGGNVAAGKAVFAANGCANCHTFQPAGSNGTIGPNLDTAPTESAKADGNMPLAAFIKQSIVQPDAYIAKGYTKGLMPTTFGSQLSKTQINDLVAFILSGAKS